MAKSNIIELYNLDYFTLIEHRVKNEYLLVNFEWMLLKETIKKIAQYGNECTHPSKFKV